MAFRFVGADVRVTDMTYRELAERSRRAAHFLAERGSDRETVSRAYLAKAPTCPP